MENKKKNFVLNSKKVEEKFETMKNKTNNSREQEPMADPIVIFDF
jgi:hypothetical protein